MSEVKGRAKKTDGQPVSGKIDICDAAFHQGPKGCTTAGCPKKHQLNFKRIEKGICHRYVLDMCNRKDCWFSHEIPQDIKRHPTTTDAAKQFINRVSNSSNSNSTHYEQSDQEEHSKISKTYVEPPNHFSNTTNTEPPTTTEFQRNQNNQLVHNPNQILSNPNQNSQYHPNQYVHNHSQIQPIPNQVPQFSTEEFVPNYNQTLSNQNHDLHHQPTSTHLENHFLTDTRRIIQQQNLLSRPPYPLHNFHLLPPMVQQQEVMSY